MISSVSPFVPVSWGELLDKITILEIKQGRIRQPDAQANVAKEYGCLRSIASHAMHQDGIASLLDELRTINEDLCDIEVAIRGQEAEAKFNSEFIQLARSVYMKNDRRAALKRAINLQLHSDLIEEKSYNRSDSPSAIAHARAGEE
jgi:hypothetical protein